LRKLSLDERLLLSKRYWEQNQNILLTMTK